MLLERQNSRRAATADFRYLWRHPEYLFDGAVVQARLVGADLVVVVTATSAGYLKVMVRLCVYGRSLLSDCVEKQDRRTLISRWNKVARM